jgi:hypothetical protein
VYSSRFVTLNHFSKKIITIVLGQIVSTEEFLPRGFCRSVSAAEAMPKHLCLGERPRAKEARAVLKIVTGVGETRSTAGAARQALAIGCVRVDTPNLGMFLRIICHVGLPDFLMRAWLPGRLSKFWLMHRMMVSR